MMVKRPSFTGWRSASREARWNSERRDGINSEFGYNGTSAKGIIDGSWEFDCERNQ